jgi:hypothetical protein
MNKQDAEDEADRLENLAVPFEVVIEANGLWNVRVEVPEVTALSDRMAQPLGARPLINRQ